MIASATTATAGVEKKHIRLARSRIHRMVWNRAEGITRFALKHVRRASDESTEKPPSHTRSARKQITPGSSKREPGALRKKKRPVRLTRDATPASYGEEAARPKMRPMDEISASPLVLPTLLPFGRAVGDDALPSTFGGVHLASMSSYYSLGAVNVSHKTCYSGIRASPVL